MGIEDTQILTTTAAAEETGIDKAHLTYLGEYHFTEGSSNKFYCFYVIMHNGNEYAMTSWGRIGSRGQSKQHESVDAAVRVVLEKMGKGYRKTAETRADEIVLDTIAGWEDHDQFLLPESVHGKKNIIRLTKGGTDGRKVSARPEKKSKEPKHHAKDFMENLRKL